MNNKKRFLYYLKYERLQLIIVIVFSLLFSFAQLSFPFIVGKTIDAALTANGEAFSRYLIYLIVLTVFGIFANNIFEDRAGVLTQRIAKRMRDDVYAKYNSISIKDISSFTKGDLLQLEITDIDNMINGMMSILKFFIQGIFAIVITIIFMFMLNYALAIGVIVLTPLSVIASSLVSKYSSRFFKKQAELQSELNSVSLETINNFDLLKSYNYEKAMFENYDGKSRNLRKHAVKALFSASWVNPTTRLINNIIYSIVGVLGIILVIGSNQSSEMILKFNLALTLGGLASFLTYTSQYTKPFNDISNVVSEYESAKHSFARINSFLNIDDANNSGTEIIDYIKTIEFRNVSFSYDKTKPLIVDFNLKFKNGDKIAIVGETGAGKTTLINLLLGFYKPDKGEILINDIPLSMINKQSFFQQIGIVLQDSWIFTGSIKDNIGYAKQECASNDIVQASKISHADSFIFLLPRDYETVISSKYGLSEGQKQMVSIARAVLQKPNFVILDEATSNVDTRSEKLIYDDFNDLMKNSTSLVIAHRLSTIVSADKIIVIKNGSIIEVGSHLQLMSNKKYYYQMFSAQFIK